MTSEIPEHGVTLIGPEAMEGHTQRLRKGGLQLKPLDFPDLIDTIQKTLKATGKNINLRSRVEFGRERGNLWTTLNLRLRKFGARNPDCGFNSLDTFMKKYDLKLKSDSDKFDFEALSDTIRKTLEDGPIRLNDEVRYGVFKGTKWSNVNITLHRYAVKNPDCGYSYLHDFMEKNGLKDPSRITFTFPDAIATIKATIEATGKRPSASHGAVKHGPYKDKAGWVTIAKHISDYAKANPDCGFTSFLTFMEHNKLGQPLNLGLPPLTATEIFNAASKDFAQKGEVPNLKDVTTKIGGFSLYRLNKAFNDISSMPDLADFVPEGKALPQNLRDFLLVTGLARMDGQKLVPSQPILTAPQVK